MTKIDLAALRELHANATRYVEVWSGDRTVHKAVNAIPALLDRIDELEGENKQLRNITVGQRLSLPPKPIAAFDMLPKDHAQ